MYPREIVLKYYTLKLERRKEEEEEGYQLRITKRYICVYNLVRMYHTVKLCVGMDLKLYIFITLTLG